MKYTKEILASAVAQSISYSQVLRILGVGSSSMHAHIKQRIAGFGIDASHFLGQGSNRGSGHVGGPEKLEWPLILLKNRKASGCKESSEVLRRAMMESGMPYLCATCKGSPSWMGKKLTLEIDHVNGDNRDNERTNVRFLCPNCHSQTGNFRSKNRGGTKEEQIEEIHA